MFKRTEILRDIEWGDGGGYRIISSPIDESKECKKSFLAKIWSWLVD